MTDVQVKELKDQISEFVTKGHKKFDELDAQGKSNSEGLAKLIEDFTAKSEELTQVAAKIAAEEEERKQLEAMIARMPEQDPEKAKADPEYRKAFRNYGRRRALISEDVERKNAIQLLNHYGITDEKDIEEVIVKAGLVGSNPDGGYLAPIDPVRFISQRLFETSPVRQLANVISTAREAVEVVIDDTEPGSGWVAELDARPETDTPSFAMVEIPTHEQYAEPRISTKALDDVTIDLEGWLQGKVASKFSRTENTGFINGDGVKKPRGILDYAAWTSAGVYERDALEYVDTATVGTLDGDDLIEIQSRLLEGYQANASWLMHRSIWGQVMKLKDDQGMYLLNPQLLFAGVNMQLLGRPVRFAGDMDSAIEEDADVAIYGDFREGYTVVDRIGIRVLRDPYTDKRFVKFYTTKRVGGAVTNYQALKVLQIQVS